MTNNSARTRFSAGNIITWSILAAIIVVGIYASFLRFSKGLGATTHLSDAVPWGLWIWFTLSRVALSAGGFILCALFFIFGVEKFHPVLRAAVLTAFVGYALVGVELIYDLGQPLHFWHPLIFWNWRSPMLETSWCIGTYMAVLGLEVSIPFTEGIGWKRLSDLLKKFCVAFALAGAVLSTLHQSSIGTIFLISSEKLSPVWYSSWLPVLFFFSALGGGIAFLILELFLAQKFLNWNFPPELVKSFGRLLLGALAIYLAAFAVDFIRLEKWSLLVRDMNALAWLSAELGLGVILPMVLLSIRDVRESALGLRLSAVLAVAGLFLNRLNVTVVGFLLESKARYFPTWQEVSITLMILAIGVAVFITAAKVLPIFQSRE